jgi:YfiH family protein
MPRRHTENNLTWHSSALLQTPNAMFTRMGGCSQPPFDSLNLSFAVGDQVDAVQENRSRIISLLGIDLLLATRQVHGDAVLVVTTATKDATQVEADALITNQPGLGLLIQQADCQAVLLHDPTRSAIAAVHCGWRGSVLGIIRKTVASLEEAYGCQPHNLSAVISPSLGPCCAEFRNHQKELPSSFLPFRQGDCHFDFWQISREQLMGCGVRPENIEITGCCTSCSRDYFSYRQAVRTDSGITGRNGSVIALEKTFP